MIDAPHGVCLAACTNIGLRYNFEACDKDLAVLAAAMDGGKGQDFAEQFLANMDALIRDFELPSRPSDLGIKKEDAQMILQKTLIQTRRIQTNPRQLDEHLLSFIEGGI
jgi:alcohol dehydrogenase class IV